ncbi:MAG: HAD-IA family hydrolase [Pseudomonadota bacterium]|nr:HAD-IA family hydrolase [Pseudomonadota bacterium]MEE3101475.1 HAD-IA family hydrolase [Pseudomonadota bacterium]
MASEDYTATAMAGARAPDFGRFASIRLVSDPLMTGETEQWSNLRWMRDILTRPLSEAAGLPVSPLASGEAEGLAFSRARFFELAGIALDPGAVQFWFDDAQVGDAALAYLAAGGLDPSALVVGYELSPQTRRLLDRLGVVYVDVWLHPVRFYEDVLFGFRSNHPGIHAALSAFHVPERQFRLYADRIKVQTYKGWRRVEADVAPGSAAFIGQTLNDKSVSDGGRMLTLLDFADEFDALGARVEARGGRVHYQRHPYVRGGDERILNHVASRPWAFVSDAPTYHLLASPNLEEVMTISSSVAQEARYFDKAATILFRPIVEFVDPSAPGQFHSIHQDFVSPHFWAAILAPAMPVLDAEPVRFVDPKDKVRDMLGFYWSWKQVDKQEHARMALGDVQRAMARRPAGGAPAAAARPKPPFRPAKPNFTPFANTLETRDLLHAAIDGAETVSFDVFETLIERVLEKPEQMFLFMGKPVQEALGGAIPNFIEARRAARDWALADSVGEEVPLAARYRAIGARHGLSDAQTDWLLELELDTERRMIRRRDFGALAFERARAAGKRVILISDTFFDRAFVEELLTRCGYSGWDALYVSSEAGALKRTGALFAHVLEREQVRPETILHIGDNALTDVKRAEEAGLKTFRLLATSDVARKVSPLMAVWDRLGDPRAAAAIKGLTARRVGGAPRKARAGFSQGEVATLGYAVLGPMFFGFANWVRRKAIEDGVSSVLFLSRDGEIVKRCYDVLAALDPEAPPSRYLLASRRAVNVATMSSAEDLVQRISVNFSPCPFAELLTHRFGVTPADLPAGALQRHGFADPDAQLDWGADRERLARLLSDPEVAAAVLANAAEERAALLDWYAEQGVTPEAAASAAIVDIGHMGSLQKGLRDLFGAPSLRGYYFATYDGVAENIPDAAQRVAAYRAEKLNPRSKHPYVRWILMYETVFLNAAGSFLRIRRDADGRLAPEELELEGEQARRDFARTCHDASVAFCQDLADGFGDAALRFRLSGPEAASAYAAMLEHPFQADAKLFRGVGFENRYSGRDVKYVVHPRPAAPGASSIWKEGAGRIVAARRAEAEAKRRASFRGRAEAFLKRLGLR